MDNIKLTESGTDDRRDTAIASKVAIWCIKKLEMCSSDTTDTHINLLTFDSKCDLDLESKSLKIPRCASSHADRNVNGSSNATFAVYNTRDTNFGL